MRWPRGAWAAVVVGVVAFAGEVGGQALVLWHHLAGGAHGYQVWSVALVFTPVLAAMAVVLLSRRPGNRIGWLAGVAAIISVLQLDGGAVASMRDVVAVPGWLATPGAYISVVAQGYLVLSLPLAMLLFPDGRLVSRRWRWVYLLLGIALVGATSALFQPLDGVYLPGGNALHQGSLGPVATQLDTYSGPLILALAVAGVAALVARWRAGDATTRQQIRWVIWGGVFAVFTVAVVNPIGSALLTDPTVFQDLAWTLGPAAIPATMGLAILRYRLYDIDRIVSRTASYLLVTGLLIGVYLGCVVLLTRAAPFSSAVGVAGSTLAAAALFAPLRRRVQTLVDRRFNRSRYDASLAVTAFANRLREQVELDAIRSDLLAAVAATVQPTAASLWMRTGSQAARQPPSRPSGTASA